MRLLESQTTADALAGLAYEAAELLAAAAFRDLAERFGYALAFDRDPAGALAADLAAALARIPGATRITGLRGLASVERYAPNATGLVAAVECRLGTDGGADVILELVVTGSDGDLHLTVEDVSALE